MSPADPTTASLERTLGRMEGRMDAISEQIAEILEQMKAERLARQAAEADQKARLGKLEAEVKALMADLATVKPLAEKWSRWQSIGFGMFIAVSGIWGMLMGVAKAIHDYFPGLIGGGRP